MTKDSIKRLLLEGFDINYRNHLTICKLSNYKIKRREYQVHCSHNKSDLNFSFLYENIDTAIDKFLGLKLKIDENSYELKTRNRKVQQVPTTSKT